MGNAVIACVAKVVGGTSQVEVIGIYVNNGDTPISGNIHATTLAWDGTTGVTATVRFNSYEAGTVTIIWTFKYKNISE